MAGPLREILAYFGIEVDTEEMKKAEKEVEGFVEKLKGIGGAVAAAFAVEKVKEFVFGLAESAEKLENQAMVLGIGTNALQEWQFAAGMSGISADAMTAAMMRLEKGGKAGAAGLQKLGLTAKDAHGESKPVTQLMDEIADKVAKIEDPMKRGAALTGLFGKTGMKMAPMFEHGAEGIKKFRDEVAALGGGLNEDFIKKSKEMLQNSKRLNMAWESFKVRVASELMPAVTTLIMWLTKGSVWLIKLSDDTNLLTATLVALGAGAVVALSAMIGPLGAILLEMAPLIIAFLLLEDFITFLLGGESEFGDAIDAIFGAGNGEKVRAWIMAAIDDFMAFVGAVTGGSSEASQKWRDDWEFFSNTLKKDLPNLGRLFIWMCELFTGGFSNAMDQIGAVWGITTSFISMGWIGLTRGFKNQIWGMEDAFSTFVNGILEGAGAILKAFRWMANAAGASELVEGLDKAVAGLQKSSRIDNHSQEGNKELDTQQSDNERAILAYTDRIQGVHTTSKALERDARDNPMREQKVDIHINVPHGTPHGVAHAAGEASEEGVHRANAAALIPGDA